MKSQLEKIVEWLRSFVDGVRRTCAATELAKNGRYRAANRLINGKKFST